MKDLPVSERPYEKLEKSGAKILSDAELISIILGNGTRDESAVDLSRRLLNELERLTGTKGPEGIYKISLEELKSIKGIGRVKAIRLKAVSELVRRIASSDTQDKKKSIKDAKDVSNIFMEEMRRYEEEVFKTILLDTKNNVIRSCKISVGTINSSLVSPQIVFREAVRTSCASVIFIHNHPSGDPTPSQEDIETTNILIRSGNLLGINVLDHIIFGNGKYYSFKGYNLM
jgi:DNA repair protein RadC